MLVQLNQILGHHNPSLSIQVHTYTFTYVDIQRSFLSSPSFIVCINYTPETVFVCPCVSLTLINTLISSMCAYFSSLASHEIQLTYFSMLSVSVCFMSLSKLLVCVKSVLSPGVNLKVMVVDLAGVRPLTAPSRLGVWSDWTLTQYYSSARCLCL